MGAKSSKLLNDAAILAKDELLSFLTPGRAINDLTVNYLKNYIM